MLHRRPGSVFAYAISLTAMMLTMIVGTMAYFESSNKQATSEKWRDVAEQAARSGLDYVIGWGEANIDSSSHLPTEWEMNDGQVMDPVRQYIPTPTILANAAAVIGMGGNPAGMVIGTNVGEYVLNRIGNYVVTFKARVQQFRFSNDAPRQYRIGIVGRVRKSSLNPVNVDVNEKADIVAERVLTATLGKEPFSRYAALIDIDAVKNWVPGEVVQGPVHINRGYLDLAPRKGTNIQATNSTFTDERSFMKIHTVGGPGGFQAVNGRTYPIFQDRVTMTVINDTPAGPENDDVATGSSFLSIDGAAPGGGNTATRRQVFQAPDNQTSLNNGPGPIPIASAIPLPVNSRRRIPVALGLPGDRQFSLYKGWIDGLEDGIYIPTKQFMTTGTTAAQFNYSPPNNFAAGGIYVRGNVEVMRTAVSGQFSYYLFQLGYGAGSIHRTYIIRADRVNRILTMRAWPTFSTTDQTQVESSPNGINRIMITHGANLNVCFTTGVTNPNAQPTDFEMKLAGGGTGPMTSPMVTLAAVPASVANHPFNGIILVDCSKYDPFRYLSVAQQNNPANHAISGNIYSLGDPGTMAAPTTKRPLMGVTHDLICTNDNADPNAATNCSRLTILTSGHVFIQNHLLLYRLYTNGQWNNPVGDSIGLNNTRDLLGIVADRQVLMGLAAPGSGGNRTGVGLVVHAAIAALGDPDNVGGRTGIRAYWGSVATEALQTVFGNPGEAYDVAAIVGGTPQSRAIGTATDPRDGSVHAVWPPGDLPAAGKVHYNQPDPNLIAGNPYFVQYTNIATVNTNPNLNTRGRLLVFGSVTQEKRGSVGAGNLSFDKDFRYDKRLMSIAPPMFPSSTSVAMRVSSVFAPGDFPYLGGTTNGRSTNSPDLNFFAVPAPAIATPAP